MKCFVIQMRELVIIFLMNNQERSFAFILSLQRLNILRFEIERKDQWRLNCNKQMDSQSGKFGKVRKYKIASLIKIIACIVCVGFSIFLVDNILGDERLTNSQERESSLDKLMESAQVDDSSLSVRFLSQKSQQAQIPKTLWLYSSNQGDKSSPQFIFKQLNHLNSRQMAFEQNYTINELSTGNYHQYLSSDSRGKIQKVLGLLDERLSKKVAGSEEYVQLSSQKETITKRLIIYSILQQNGGIFIDNTATLVQPLNQLITEIYLTQDLNQGEKVISPQKSKCFGFYNEEYSSMKNRVEELKRDYDFEKDVVMYPNLEDYFIACETGSKLLEKLIEVYVDLLTTGRHSEWLKDFNDDEKLIGKTIVKQIHTHGHITAMHIVLQNQQQLINQQKSGQSLLAIDTLQLKTINHRLSPTKLQSQFMWDKYKSLSYMTKLTLGQLQILIGRMKYVFYLENYVVDMLISELMRGETEREFVVEDSFVDVFWFSRLRIGRDQEVIESVKGLLEAFKGYNVMRSKEHEEAQNSNTASTVSHNVNKYSKSLLLPKTLNSSQKLPLNLTNHQWSTLQKNIWIIWDNGIQKSNFIVEMCYQNLKLSAQNSNFTINIVSRQNVYNFISKQLIDNINFAIQNAAFELSNQAIADMWRLALVYEHGGVYLDASTFQVDESFDWILQLPQIPRNLIWNRYGQSPQVFMLFNSYYGSPLDWHIDKQHDTKKQWHLSYENNFIVAQKGSKLIKQWLDTMMEWIQQPFDIVYEQMKNAQITGHSWTSDNGFAGPQRYLTAMDAIKFVIGRRQKMIRQQHDQNDQSSSITTAPQYYRLWSMPGQMLGQQKFRGQTNYQNRDYRLDKEQTGLNNVYRYKYPLQYVESVMGPALFQVKFFGYELIHLNKFFNDFYRQNSQRFQFKTLEEIIHPQSVLAKKLLNPFPDKTVECLEKYVQLNEIKIKLKAINKIWSY